MAREYRVSERNRRPPTHPGEVLGKDILPALGLSVRDAAVQLGVTRQTLHRILAKKQPVTPEMAVRLGKFCGNGPTIWLRLQGAYDLWHAEKRLRRVLARIPEHRPAA